MKADYTEAEKKAYKAGYYSGLRRKRNKEFSCELHDLRIASYGLKMLTKTCEDELLLKQLAFCESLINGVIKVFEEPKGAQ